MPQTLIDGVYVKPQRINVDERGPLMEVLRPDWDVFRKFGQVYVTPAHPGVVKAWHYHQKQWDHFTYVGGTMKVVLYDDRKGAPTRGTINEFVIGERNPLLVQIPPLVHHGLYIANHELALRIIQEIKPGAVIDAARAGSPRKAKRPGFSASAETKTAPKRHWQEALADYLSSQVIA